MEIHILVFSSDRVCKQKEKSMFKITEETKAEAIEAMKKIMSSNGAEVPSDEVLLEAFEAAVAIVKKQFGM